jgi:hypothetical protein
VTITVKPDSQTSVGWGTGVARTYTFNNGNWSTPQTINVTADDDDVAEGPHTSRITHSASSNNTEYNAISISDLIVNITDNDTAGVTINESGGVAVSEASAGTDSYTLVLRSEPTADVTITITPDDQTSLGGGAGVAITKTFTSANWDTVQTVTVYRVNDSIAEGPHTSRITHAVSSDDPVYSGISVSDVEVSVTDDDTAGVTINESGGVAVSEAGPTSDSYTVVLKSQPTADVTITITPDAQTSLGSGAGVAITKTFTTGNWGTAQTVTVTAVDDTDEEGDHTSTITHAASSYDPNYSGIAIGLVTVAVSDNDVASVILTESGNSTTVNEEGTTTDTYTVVLASQPTADVTITITPDAQISLGSGAGVAITKTFTSANWSTSQTVTVTAVDDAVDEDTHLATITHSAASGDSRYNGISVPAITVTVMDNDTAGVTLTQSGGTTAVSEVGPSSDNYTIVLKTKPTADVTVTITPDAQVTLGAGAGIAIIKTFTALNWNTPQTVTVTAIDDSAAEGPHTSTLSHSLSSDDANYDGRVVSNIVVSVTDNDVAGVTITQSGGSTDVSEATSTTNDTYTINLNSPPTSDVTVTITPDSQTSLGSGAGVAITRTFTASDWDTAQTVNVFAIDDTAAEGTHTSTISHSLSSVDPHYNGLAISNVVVNVTDNDVAGVTITETGGSTDVNENDTIADTYQVVLNTPPQNTVTITVTPDAQTNLGSGGGVAVTLVFTVGNWDDAQTVSVKAVDDLLAEGAHVSTITHTSASTDPNYNGVAVRNVTAHVTDNDESGVTITETGGSTNVSEAGTTNDTYGLVLNSPPSANVVITVTPDSQVNLGSGQGVPITLTFTTANWGTQQDVTVTAIDDSDAEGPHISTITHTASSTDANYNGRTIRNTIVYVADNDVAGVTLTETDLSTVVSEASIVPDTYTVVLNRPPTSNVTVTITPDSQISLGAGAGTAVTLTFTTANWNTAQTISVTAINDTIAEGTTASVITHSVSSGDANYNNIDVRNIPVTVIDNDTVGATIAETDGATNVSEEGATTDTYTLSLNTEPTANVVVTVTPDSQVNLGGGVGTPVTLTFTPSDWSTAQTITVKAYDDSTAEGAHYAHISHTTVSADPNYNGIVIAEVVASVADNDTLGISVVEPDNRTSVSEENTTSDTYTIKLNTCPSADVAITITPDSQINLSAGAATPITLTFTPANWNVAQTVTVTAIDDLDAEDAHTSIITHYATSLDPNYSGIAVRNVIVYIADNDISGVTITESGGSTDVSEDGPSSDTYTVVLKTPPTLATVTITVDPDIQTDVGAGAGVSKDLTFTSANWNVPQTVTVTAVDDAVAEGPHKSTITHTAASIDPDYNGIVISTVSVNVTDDDSASVVISESSGSVVVNEEGPTSSTYTVVLSIAPTSTVTVTVDPDTQTSVGAGQGSPVNLIFTTSNWSTPQSVTVTAIDDTAAEGSHTSTITHTAASADPNYNGISIRNITASVIDNDTAGVTITQTDSVTEVSETGPTSDTYTIVLDIPPTSNVVITVNPDDQTDLGAGAGATIDLTFTAANWNVPQTVTVTAVDDEVAENAEHSSTITHSASSADTNYNRITISPVTVMVHDNDTAGVTVTESGGSTDLAETGPTFDTYTLVLNTPPVADVTITLAPDEQVDLGAGAGHSIQRTFTAATWNEVQTITVTAVDDLFAEGDHRSIIAHTVASSDPNYNAIVVASVTADITDNDIAGVTIVQSGGSTVLGEAGSSADTYTAVLNTQPTANVTLIAQPDEQSSLGQGAGEAISMVFTPSNWNVPQTITVTPIDDVDAEGLHKSIITHSVTSTDLDYNRISVSGIIAQITDNDVAGLSITESNASTCVSEDGVTDTYTVVLNTRPTADVILTVTPDTQCNLGEGAGEGIELTFTPTNWNVAQTITVRGVDDYFAEGRHAGTITHIFASTDTIYNGLAVRDVTVTIDDNDTEAVNVVDSNGETRVNEAGTLVDSYQIVLSTACTSKVIIVASPESGLDLGDGAGHAISLVFTPADWNVPQTVTVTGVDDSIYQGTHTATIEHTAFTADGSYSWNSINDVTVYIEDDDAEGFLPCAIGGIFSIVALLAMGFMIVEPSDKFSGLYGIDR